MISSICVQIKKGFERKTLETLAIAGGEDRINLVLPMQPNSENNAHNGDNHCVFVSIQTHETIVSGFPENKKPALHVRASFICGEDRIRTDDLLTASQAL